MSPHSNPQNLDPNDDSYGAGGLPSPRTPGYPSPDQDQLGGYSQVAGGAGSPGVGYASHPSLPRYPSTNSPALSPLNPSGNGSGVNARPGYVSGASSRYSTLGNNNSGHPLKATHYADSNPTLNDGYDPPGSDEKGPRAAVRRQSVSPPESYQASPGNEPGPMRGPYGQRRSQLETAYRRLSGAYVADSGKDPRHMAFSANSPGRLGYLDGLKFICAIIVLNGTLFDAVLTDDDYTGIQRGSPLYIFRSVGLGISFFLIILGRVATTPLWDVPPPNSTVPSTNSEKPPTRARPSISWPRLTRAMLTRPFRFILPVIFFAALQWGLGANGKTKNCNAVGMDEPYWNVISSFSGLVTLVFDLFTYFEQDTLAGKTFGGNLWTTPWLFQASYCAYVVHMMMGNLSSNRYWVYGILAFFSWTTYNFFFLAVIGVAIADLAVHGHLDKIRKASIITQSVCHIVLLAIACVTQFVGPIRSHVNSGMATINVQDHPELTFCDAIFATCIILIVETSNPLRMVFGNIVMRTLGRLAPGVYLFASPLLFTIIADLALSLSNNGSSAPSILGVSWLVLFAASLGLAIPFHFFIELPSKFAGVLFADFVETWGLDDAEKKKIRRTLVRPKKDGQQAGSKVLA